MTLGRQKHGDGSGDLGVHVLPVLEALSRCFYLGAGYRRDVQVLRELHQKAQQAFAGELKSDDLRDDPSGRFIDGWVGD